MLFRVYHRSTSLPRMHCAWRRIVPLTAGGESRVIEVASARTWPLGSRNHGPSIRSQHDASDTNGRSRPSLGPGDVFLDGARSSRGEGTVEQDRSTPLGGVCEGSRGGTHQRPQHEQSTPDLSCSSRTSGTRETEDRSFFRRPIRSKEGRAASRQRTGWQETHNEIRRQARRGWTQAPRL